MHTYNYDLIKNHIIVHQGDETWLIDTGAPVTLSTRGSIRYAGEEFPAPPGYLGVHPGQLDPHVGLEITTLVGMDLLGKYPVEFNPLSRTMVVEGPPLSEEAFALPLEFYLTIPVIEVGYQGNPIRVIFDTGAQIGYLDGHLTREFPDLEEFTDFFPTLGTFQTTTRRVPFSLGGQAVEQVVGENPNFLQPLFLMSDTVGILGTELLGTFTIQLDVESRQLRFIQGIRRGLGSDRTGRNGHQTIRDIGEDQPDDGGGERNGCTNQDQQSNIHVQVGCHRKRARRGRHQRMRQRAAGGDGEDGLQEVTPRPFVQ